MIVCLNVIVSDTDEHAEYLAYNGTNYGSITRGRMQAVQPPTDDLKGLLTREYELAQQRFAGSP